MIENLPINENPITPKYRREIENCIVLGGKSIPVSRLVKKADSEEFEIVNETVFIRMVNSLREYFSCYAAFDNVEDCYAVSRFFIKWNGETEEQKEAYLDSLTAESHASIEEVARKLNFTRVSEWVEPRLELKEKKMLKAMKLNLTAMESLPERMRGQVSDAFTRELQASLANKAADNGQKK